MIIDYYYDSRGLEDAAMLQSFQTNCFPDFKPVTNRHNSHKYKIFKPRNCLLNQACEFNMNTEG